MRLATKAVSVVPLCVFMSTEKITYFQYARKSSEEEGRQSLSIDGQLKDNLQVIKRNNLKVIETITDEASAAIPFNRTGYTEMIRRIKNGEASGIVVWHVDRLIRNPLEEGEFKWLLQTGIIKSIWTPGREYRSEDNGLLFSIEASMAAQYSRDLSVKVRRGMKQKFEAGQPAMKAPIGYLNTKFQAHGTNYILEDPTRFPVLRKGFDMLLTGAYTITEITTILYKEYGLESTAIKGRPVSRPTMYRIFTNPFYYGAFTRNGVEYRGSYKPLITMQEFDRVQEILGRKGKPRPKRHSFAFTGFMKCGSCGSAITASEKTKAIKATGTYKTYVFYHCTKRKTGYELCTDKKYTTKEQLESLIIEELTHYEITPVFKEWILEYMRDKYKDEIERNKALAHAVEVQEQKLVQELDTLLDLRIAGSINEEKFQEKKQQKEQLLARARAKKAESANNSIDWIEHADRCLEFAVGIVAAFKEDDDKAKKLICQEFGWNWQLKGKKLFVCKRDWLIDLREIKEVAKLHMRPLEPGKTFVKSDYNMISGYVMSEMRRLRNDIGPPEESYPLAA